MKNINRSMLLLSVVLFCFVGCSESAQTFESDPRPTENLSSSSLVSDNSIDESSMETSSSNDDISDDHIDIENLKFDFTEDDLWLQSFLKENWSMAYYLFHTYVDPSYEIHNESKSDPEHKYRYFLREDRYDLPYDLVENTYFNNAEEYQVLLDKYFFSDGSKMFIPKADIVDPENDYISIRGDQAEPQLIEINGRLYHAASGMGGEYVPFLDKAKVITKTDNEIVFSYLCCLYNAENVMAGKGVLKKEDGVWKFGWFYIDSPIEILDIHEVWGI